MTKILFLHQNYPAQFGALGKYMAKQGWDVTFATAADGLDKNKVIVDQGVKIVGYRATRDASESTHRYLKLTESAILNGQGFARLGIKLRNGGYTPDIVVAHSGWGSGSFVKSVWPDTKYVQYLEWWYEHPARDSVHPPAEKNPEDAKAKIMARNLPFMLDWAYCDGMIMPTEFQAAGLPDHMRHNMILAHDGVDDEFFSPAKLDEFKLPKTTPPDDAQVLTYATRGMEPYRGFPQFMEALSKVQKTHPDFHAIIGGNDSVHYGPKLPKGDGWKGRMLKKFEFDETRMHFPGKLPFAQYRDLLRRSNGHVYLSVPFVLSWSMIESMATGCPMIVTDNTPIREALPESDLAKFVKFGDVDGLADAMRWALDNPKDAAKMAKKSRLKAQKDYGKSKLYPKKIAFFESIIAGKGWQHG